MRSSRWELTPDALERLMARLDADPTVAGEKYEHLRRALAKFFQWHGTPEPDGCADETLDRLARRLESGQAIDDVPTFARGVARLVRLERVRQAAATPLAFDTAIAERVAAPEPEAADERFEHVQACLSELPEEDRDLIVRYYTGEGREKIALRSRMARELGISDNALRHRAQRLREQLKQCARRHQHGSAYRDRSDRERR
jgi:DNA-directed RNA polymerase specialized sigma24 family protein